MDLLILVLIGWVQEKFYMVTEAQLSLVRLMEASKCALEQCKNYYNALSLMCLLQIISWDICGVRCVTVRCCLQRR